MPVLPKELTTLAQIFALLFTCTSERCPGPDDQSYAGPGETGLAQLIACYERGHTDAL
jgi:hypothetical protein